MASIEQATQKRHGNRNQGQQEQHHLENTIATRTAILVNEINNH